MAKLNCFYYTEKSACILMKLKTVQFREARNFKITDCISEYIIEAF